MEFNGTFELEDTTTEEVWLALSDPVLVEESLPGCEFLVRVDDGDVDFDALRAEHADRAVEPTADPDVIADRAFEEGERYAALIQISVGPVNPTFETVVTIDRREEPEMSASGEGSSGDSSFEMSSSMALSEAENGVAVEWEAEADVFGRVAQMGQRVVNPVANQVVKRFFSSVQEELRDLSMSEGAATGDESTASETADGTGASASAAADAGAAESSERGETTGEQRGETAAADDQTVETAAPDDEVAVANESTESASSNESTESESSSESARSKSASESGSERDDRSLVDRILGWSRRKN